MGHFVFFFFIVVANTIGVLPPLVLSENIVHYQFDIKMKNVTRLCHTKSIVTVNGEFPGPEIVAGEGDRVMIKVVNHVDYNVTLHWHGVRQMRSCWADGPAYITQCPIQKGQSFVYDFTVTDQRGTLFWHAHISWLRVTLYGPIVVFPKESVPYPFPKPHEEVLIMLGEWWNANVESVIQESSDWGGPPTISDAYTINALPGPSYACSSNDTFKVRVKPSKTYLLRIINAILNTEMFFTIADHEVTVVETDAVYVKPFKAGVLFISPGQTMNVLLHTKSSSPSSSFLLAASPYASGAAVIDGSTTLGILEYEKRSSDPSSTSEISLGKLLRRPYLPDYNDSSFAMEFSRRIRSLANQNFPAYVPQNVDRYFFFTVGVGLLPCSHPKTKTKECLGPYNLTFAASINNISFLQPNTAILQAHYLNQSKGVYTTDFPAKPLYEFNYAGGDGTPPSNSMVSQGTKVVVIPFNTSVELILQGTSPLGAESHPLHFHGHNFFVVGQGFGNFDPVKDPRNYNLVDPAARNTVSVPSGGWVAIRFVADNPGAWLMHCHIEAHTSWGMKMVWIVTDGRKPNEKLPPPPSDLPKC